MEQHHSFVMIGGVMGGDIVEVDRRFFAGLSHRYGGSDLLVTGLVVTLFSLQSMRGRRLLAKV